MEKVLPVIVIMAGATILYLIIGYKFLKKRKNKEDKNGDNQIL